MLFAYDTAQFKEIHHEICSALKLQSTRVVGVSAEHFRHAVRVLLNHDRLLVPTSIDHCTPNVERLKAIAHHCGIDVKPLAGYLSETHHQPAAAAAVPPAQRNAVAG